MNKVFKSFVIHDRKIPKKYKFGFNFFWYLLDLDHIERFNQSTKWFSYNSFNLFSLYDSDHFQKNGDSIREKVSNFLKANQVSEELEEVKILTNLRFLGYVFNPVCYYFIKTKTQKKYCVIEICNTYKERKAYFVDHKYFDGKNFTAQVEKEFYISPFSALDNEMKFIIGWPENNIQIHIFDYLKDMQLELKTHLTGDASELTDKSLIKAAIMKPFATFQIIWAIHWHALKLYLKRIPYFKKDDNKHLQRGYY